MKLWGGRFKKPTNALVEEFNASISYDQRLAAFDIVGSLAHVKALGRCAVLNTSEVEQISHGLQRILHKVKHAEVTFSVADEDIHMNIERLLHVEIGDLAGKLHTGRSRNDQVALDMHLYLREQVYSLVQQLLDLQQALFAKAQAHIDTILPGYTHLQRAQPVRFAHHLLAYCAMFGRDIARLCDSWKRINVSPLGAGALAGSGIAIDRHYVAELLGFDGIYDNSMDAVSDRDYLIEFQAAAALIMMHLSRISEELILWSTQEFAFITLDDAFCTGSSMMPQKKNPDIPELVRGKTGRVYGSLMGLLTTLKGLPLTYNKDCQEDKEGLFDCIDTVSQSLAIFTPLIASMTVNEERMRQAASCDFSNATVVANYLVAKDVPFRQAHEVTGKIVLHCIEHKQTLYDLTIEDYQRFSEHFRKDIYQIIALPAVVDAQISVGGTARVMVKKQIAVVKEQMARTQTWLGDHECILKKAL